jgi:disulfide bond formation protein DsbB
MNQSPQSPNIFAPPYAKWHYVLFFQALVATLGSLYYSNYGDPVRNLQMGLPFGLGGGYEPCHLCWWARIFMYPIVVISLIGIWKKDRNYLWYTLALAIPGTALEVYQYSIQMYFKHNPAMTIATMGCPLDKPCAAIEIIYLDFITIPFLCLVAFVVVLAINIYLLRASKKIST